MIIKKNMQVGIYLTLMTGCSFAGTMGPMTETQKLYLRADIGYNFFSDPIAMTASATNTPEFATSPDIHDHVGYSGGVGYKFFPSVRGDLTFTYRPSINFNLTDSVPEVGHGSFNNYTLMANGYYDLDFNIPLIPYVTAGFGISSNQTDNIYWPVVMQNEYGQNNQSVVWQVGAGLSYAMQENLLIDFSYQYIDLGTVSNTGHFDTNGLFGSSSLIGAATVFRTLYSNQIQLGVRYYV